MVGKVKLTEAHLHALDMFAHYPLGADEIETTDIRAGCEVISWGLVELRAPLIGDASFVLTESGRAHLASRRDD